ncbi:hypothetical protein D3C77_166150 [compost metagenome]|uniref:HvfC/BufC N-terminal domain-containing protein n=1 Tax=Pseudomonas TaxID=286 RepID=UPI00040103F3|nr:MULTISPECIES: DNA-binding domain-containing protein [Pseudomonas]MCW2269736.1 hypothetical protein [Pseudomonas sp. JUb96]PRA58655.1 DUF2063 domain-containing protein [Pseudomonas sp. MYb187]
MKMSLAQFQDAFTDALYQRPAPQLASLVAQPGFEVYRNTVLKGCVDAICDNFPAVERLVGHDWLAAVAAIYACHAPPTDARMMFYGGDFADFLEAFEPVRQLTYLPDVARLDRLWLETFAAPLEPGLRLDELTGMTASDLARCSLRPRENVRWRWFAGQPIYSLWHCNRQAQALPEPLPWHGEGALLVGNADGVAWQPLQIGECAFLDACAAGQDLEHASDHALHVQAELDFNTLLGRLLAAQVFAPLILPA